ncbi:hypothetical protein [Winogradskyella haliclonae]|uniref:Uncharacterized protein n=1 Tax=Winogradskyella haliclonae TaxID=2048558 RepID=A0ABQ2BV40_9FLAO|nr:hypothetical protein [Winogradskyella haliclonae]GGI56351.1 hypothetical protein GCM10011444_06600 [Winogradskyella haliclonae]
MLRISLTVNIILIFWTIENTLRFYPNPASSSVNVGLRMDMQNGAVDMTLSIYDLTGK